MQNQHSISIAVVGATGLVGRAMLEVLAARQFPVGNLRLFASQHSAGARIHWQGREYTVEELRPESFRDIDVALFSAGKSVSEIFAPLAVDAGCTVIDNSSAWRLNPGTPLVVPEVNAAALTDHNGIIANPNCSTIQLVVALEPIRQAFGLRKIVVSTYQSVSGAGQKGVDQLHSELDGVDSPSSPFPHKVAFNTVFHSFGEADGLSEEELKMVRETRRIFGLPELDITVTCVRIPTLGAHGESVTIVTERQATVSALHDELRRATGVRLVDNPLQDQYPTVLQAEGHDDVFVGRVRQNPNNSYEFSLWVVADNIRKGAATNAVQIAEELVTRNILRIQPTAMQRSGA